MDCLAWGTDGWRGMDKRRELVPLRLQQLLIALNVNARTMAKETGLAENLISMALSGAQNLSLNSAVKICDRYKVTLDWLFLGDPSGLPARIADKLPKKPANPAPDMKPTHRLN